MSAIAAYENVSNASVATLFTKRVVTMKLLKPKSEALKEK